MNATTMNTKTSRMSEIRELTGEELDLVSGGGDGAVLGHLAGGVVGALIDVAGALAGVALTVTGHSS